MGVRVFFVCNHEGCERFYTLDSALPHTCDDPRCQGAILGDQPVPLDLRPLVHFLTDHGEDGGGGWEILLFEAPGSSFLFEKVFCPEHGADIKAIGGIERVPAVTAFGAGMSRNERRVAKRGRH